jgi:GST-like protein
MLQLHTWGTPNGYKPLILLHELAEDFELFPVNLRENAQKSPEYLKINPNGKIPALVDTTAKVTLFESGAILWYLASKYGQFLPVDGQPRASAMSWLFFQVGGVGPMCGQAYHFRNLKEPLPYATERFTSEVKRLFGVLEGRLKVCPYLAGEEYSIADMAMWPWLRTPENFGVSWAEFPSTRAWFDRVGERAAVKKAIATEF